MGIAAQCLHGAGLCLVPKPENDHRPWLLRHGPLSFVSALLIAAKVLGVAVVALTPTPAELSTITSNRIVQLTNVERKKAGLSELSSNTPLAQAALQKGQHMLDEDYFAHISPSGVTPWFWMNKVGYAYQIAGENLAIDFIEAEDVVAAWLASPTHKENMLHANYTQTGVGVVTGEFQGGTSTIVVHMFGLPPAVATKPQVNAATAPPASPAPSPSPSVPPSPSPTPVIPAASPLPPDTTPPRVPRIAVASLLVRDALELTLTGDPTSTVTLLVNETTSAAVTLDPAGTATYTLSLADVADGQIAIAAYATDTAGNDSVPTAAVAVTKDTAGPQLAREQFSYILSPASDTPLALALVRGEYTQVTVVQGERQETFATGDTVRVPLAGGPFTLTLTDAIDNATVLEDVTLAPAYATEENQRYLTPPTRFSQLTRRLSAGFAVLLAILLVLAILVRIRIQKPAMIAHASIVILLAAVLFFV